MYVFTRLESWKAGRGRGMLAALALALGCMLLLAGCTLPWQHSANTSGLGPAPTAQQVLTTMQKNFRSVSSFHLTMKTDNLGNTDANEIVIRQAEGDVLGIYGHSARAPVDAVGVESLEVVYRCPLRKCRGRTDDEVEEHSPRCSISGAALIREHLA